MKTGKIIGITVGSIVLLGAAVYFFIRGGKSAKETKELKKKKDELDERISVQTQGGGVIVQEVEQPRTTTTTQTTTPTTPVVSAPKTTAPKLSYPIRFGNKGEKVVELQKVLLSIDKKSLPKFGADGQFGGETSAALVKYLGKASVESQADVDKLLDLMRKSILQKVGANMALSPLGITIFK
jgi:hypothetical protein